MENNNENEGKVIQSKNNSSLILIVVGLVLIIVVGVGCFFLGQKTTNNNTSNNENKESQESSSDNKENKESNEKNEEPEEETAMQDENYELSKCLNCSNYDSDTIIKVIQGNGSDLVKVNVKEDNKSVEIELSSEGFSHYGTNIKDRTIIKQLNKEIKQVLISSYGGDTGLLTIHYLMNDGTVEYTKVYDEVLKNNFDNLSDEDLFNTIEFKDVKDTVKIVPVIYDGNFPSFGVIAIQNNGYFYCLRV